MKLSVVVHHSLFAVLLCLGILLPGRSLLADDKLYLKSGEMLEGTVTEDTPAGVKILVKKGSIRETKSIARDQVDRIERPKPDEIAFKDLQSYLPTPSLLDPAGYRKRLDATDRFLKDFPDSSRRADVQKIADELKAEYAKASAGGLKINGEWITGEERKAHQENVEAEIQMANIIQMGRSGNYLQALRGINDLKTRFPKTKAYANSFATASELMKAYGRSLNQALEERKVAEAALIERKARLTPPEIQALENEATQRAVQIQRLNDQEKKVPGAKWLTVNMEDTKSIESAIDFVRRELQAQEKFKVDDIKRETDAVYEAESLLAQGKLEEADAKLKESQKVKAKTISSKDAQISRIIRDIALAKEERGKAAKLAEIEKAKQESALSTPIVPLASKEGAASAEDLLNRMEQHRSSMTTVEKEKPAEPATKGTSKSKSSAKSKSGAKASEDNADEEGTGKKIEDAADEEGGGFSFIPIIAVVFVLMLGGTGVLLYLDKKKKAAASGGEEE